MRSFFRHAVICGLALATARAALAEAPPLRWVCNLDDAKKIAAAEHKDLLVNFTGLEWCGACMDLDREVLSRQEFNTAEQTFVLVDIDLPSHREELGELQDLYNAWLKQYFIHGLPTIMLADAAGRPYAYFTGYDEESDVAAFMKRLESARVERAARDRAFAAARGANRRRARHETARGTAMHRRPDGDDCRARGRRPDSCVLQG